MTVPTPFISIIIPTLQEERLLGQTLAQFTETMRERYRLEIIVSDGGSSDKTIEIANSQADKVIVSVGTTGQNISLGRNRGAAGASGDILVFINADVIIEDIDKFFSTILRMMKNGNVVAATCNVNIYPETERFTDWVFHNFFNAYFWLLNLLGMGMGRGECHVVKKEHFRKTGGYNETLVAGEDYELFLRLHRSGKIVYIRTLTVFESPRRFRKYGYLWITVLWFLNAMSVLLFKHSVVNEWKPVR